MGNENSTTTDKSPKTVTKSVSKKRPVQGSVYRNYQPSVHSATSSNYTTSAKRNSLINDSHSPIQSKSEVSKKPAPSHYQHQQPYSPHSKQPILTTPVQQSFSIVNEDRSTPVPIIEQSSSVLVEEPLPSAVIYEKAPMIQLNYVVKSSNSKSIPTYGPDNIIVMRRTSSQPVSYGNRWYDKNYNKNAEPLVVKYL